MSQIHHNQFDFHFVRLQPDDICMELFQDFHRHQVVNLCWRQIEGEWRIQSDPFIDDWNLEDYKFLVSCLRNTARKGGFVLGAFQKDRLKGFISVEPERFGQKKEYLDLSSLHVSEEMRGLGIGRELFFQAKKWASNQGAKKLYISAHSAVESQAFYRAMGCVEAKEIQVSHVEQEPFDCQLECSL